MPNTVVPYVGAGGGAHWYRLRQQGDFVDYVDLSVFTDVFESSGWTPSAHVFGGADIKVHRRLYVTVEARYQWAAGDLGPDWIDFDPIDLSGLRRRHRHQRHLLIGWRVGSFEEQRDEDAGSRLCGVAVPRGLQRAAGD